MTQACGTEPAISVLIPAYNEEGAIGGVVEDVRRALESRGEAYEIVVVNDGSTDGTARVLAEAGARIPELRVLRFVRNAGQTAALDAAIKAARGAAIVTLDGDGQNDPGDIPLLLDRLKDYDAAFGIRTRRNDTPIRRFASWFANGVRNRLLGVHLRDTGCSLKAFRREAVHGLPLFDGFHRFLPSLVLMRGCSTVEVPVRHHPRRTGTSKYSALGRAIPALLDCLVVRRLQDRALRFEIAQD